MLTWPFFIFSFQILYPVLSRRLTSKPFALLGLVNLPWKLETMTILLPAPTFSNLSPPAFLRTHIPAHKCLHFYIFQPVRLTKFITAGSRVRKAVGRKESLQTFNKLICLFRTCKHPPPFSSSVKDCLLHIIYIVIRNSQFDYIFEAIKKVLHKKQTSLVRLSYCDVKNILWWEETGEERSNKILVELGDGVDDEWHWWHLLYLFVDVFYFLILIFWICWILWGGWCCCFYFPILMLNILRRWNWGTGWMVSDSDDTADHSNDPASPHCAAQTSTFSDFPFSYFAFYFFLYFLSKF